MRIYILQILLFLTLVSAVSAVSAGRYNLPLSQWSFRV